MLEIPVEQDMKAKIEDAKKVSSLINFYAEQDVMLFRSLADIYETIQTFSVVEENGNLVGCCALQIIWSDLGEIKSLAVDEDKRNSGVGKMLVEAAIEEAGEIGLPRVFALTLEPEFFCKLGFEITEMDKLPMKVWSDCARCSKQDHCDETAVIKTITPAL
jgi:amino-acid N-acetyltransferase